MHFSFLSRDPETFLPQLGQQAGATVHSDSFEKVLIVFAEAIERDINSQIEIEATLPKMPF